MERKEERQGGERRDEGEERKSEAAIMKCV